MKTVIYPVETFVNLKEYVHVSEVSFPGLLILMFSEFFSPIFSIFQDLNINTINCINIHVV